MIKLPKRRKSSDNPYKIDYCEMKNIYVLIFNDSRNIKQIIELTDELYHAFDEFELEDISQMQKYDKHIERFELLDEELYKRMINQSDSIENEVEKKILNDELKVAINSLDEVQKRRIKMYYFDELTLEEIAKIEGCSFQAVSKSISLALKKLYQKLKN